MKEAMKWARAYALWFLVPVCVILLIFVKNDASGTAISCFLAGSVCIAFYATTTKGKKHENRTSPNQDQAIIKFADINADGAAVLSELLHMPGDAAIWEAEARKRVKAHREALMVEEKIGNYTLQIYPEQPSDLSMENDYTREIYKIDAHLYRVTSWTGRVMYLVEYFGETVRLPYQRAVKVSKLIADDVATYTST